MSLKKVTAALSQCPSVPEESWRKSEPEQFFLPESEVLTAHGTPYVLGTAVLPWKVELHKTKDWQPVFDRLCAALPALSDLKSEELLKRTVVVDVLHGKVRVTLADELKAAIEVSSQPWTAESTAPKSDIGHALAQRLEASSPHVCVLRIQSRGEETPFILVANQLTPDFSQSYSRLKFEIGEGSHAEMLLLEGGSSFAMHRHGIEVKQGARCDVLWVSVGRDAESHHLFERDVMVAEGARLNAREVFVPQGHVRVTTCAHLQGRRASFECGSAVLASGSSFFDYEPIQFHENPCGESEFHLQTLAAQNARILFQGLIIASREAEKTKAIQENRNLLLGKRARVDASPRLEISPQDVQCKHGSASGEINETQLYYLMSRGFDIEQAKELILKGFALGVLNLEGDSALAEVASSVVATNISPFLK